MTEEKDSKRKHKSQRPNHSHTSKSHKNTKLKAIIDMKMTWCIVGPVIQSLSSYELCSIDLEELVGFCLFLMCVWPVCADSERLPGWSS